MAEPQSEVMPPWRMGWALMVGAVVSGMIAKAEGLHNFRVFLIVVPVLLAAQLQRHLDYHQARQSGSDQDNAT